MKKYANYSDQTLVELTLLGQEEAYEALVIRHQKSVLGTARKITGSTYPSEDAAQDAFLSAWMNLASLRDGSKLGPWVCAIAKNCARTLTARVRRQLEHLKLWRRRADKSGFAEEYRNIPGIVETLEHSAERTGLLAETLRTGYWWVMDPRNDAVLARLKQAVKRLPNASARTRYPSL